MADPEVDIKIEQKSIDDSGNTEMESKHAEKQENDNRAVSGNPNPIISVEMTSPDVSEIPASKTPKSLNGEIPKSPKRGILRNVNSEPVVIVSKPHPTIATGSLDGGRFRSKIESLWSTQEFVNPAFEFDENNIPSDCKLADLVKKTLRRGSEGGYIHPYGRGNLYTAVFLGERSKFQSSGGMVAFWIAFIIMVVGLAGAIILMAEMYRVNEHGNTDTANTTQAR